MKDFKIIIEKTDNGIKMKSEKGSAWINLSFSLNNYRAQAVDEYGTRWSPIVRNYDTDW